MTPRLAGDLGNRNSILAKAEFQGKVDMTNFRTAVIGLTAAALVGTQALAADVSLAPGKPAGVRQADIEAGGVLLVAGIVAVAAMIAVVASTTQGNSTTPTTGTA